MGRAPTAVYSVGDCDPAAGALNAAASGNPQMRALLRPARRLASQWLGVSVPREANSDADRLSHPSELEAVAADAAAAGLTVRRARITEASWAALRGAIAVGAGTSKRRLAD